jgi:tripeptide aminopeptidase
VPRINRDRLVDEFMALCRIDSPSRHEAAIATDLEQRLLGLGLEVRNDASGPSTGNLLGRLSATGSGRSILLTTHMDTVEPGRGVQPRLVGDEVASDGRTTILGADAKAGVAALLEGIRAIKASEQPHPLVEVVITWGEEIGHLGARHLDFDAFEARLGFCLDALCPVGQIVNHAPGYDKIRATFRGLGAHAGVEPDTGVSAIVAAARAVAGMELGRIDFETTANVGLVSGGTARNAVPAQAVLEAEARSRDARKLAEQVEHIRGCCESGARSVGAELEFDLEHDYLPYRIEETAPVARFAVAAARRAGPEPRFTASGGGSDANNFNAGGLPTVVLGIGSTGGHTVDERVSIHELERLAGYVVALIEQAASA